MGWKRRIQIVLVPILMVLALPAIAIAQSTPVATPEPETGPRFILRPADDVDGSYFTVEAAAGSIQSLRVVLGNADDEPLTLRTYAADVFTLVNGGYGVKDSTEPREEVSTWLDYETETITLEPGKGLEQEFAVTVPEGTAPGQYIAGIVLETAEPFEVEGAAMFNQVARKSIAVFITVPGDLSASFNAGAPTFETSAAGVRLVAPVENTGQVLVKPAGAVVLTDPEGNEAYRQEVAMGSVYAGMKTTLEIPLPAALPEGDYGVSVELADAESGTSAGAEAQTVALSRDVEGPAPLEIVTATVTPQPSAEEIQFARVAVTVENRDIPVEGVRVVLSVTKDGEPVEDFVVAQSVTLQQGATELEQRYLPLDGWSPGEWTFTVSLESVDPRTGAEASLLTFQIDEPITVGDR